MANTTNQPVKSEKDDEAKEIARLAKNEQIREKGKATKERREDMVKQVMELKVVDNKLSVVKEDKLQGIFREAKWIRNWLVNLPSAFYVEKLTDTVPVMAFNQLSKKCDIMEIRKLSYLGSQMKQACLAQVKQDIFNLAKKKAKGGKVGKLRNVREVNSIPLQQHGVTYTVSLNGVKVQNVGKLKVRGLDQIFPKELNGAAIGEIAMGRLVRKASGYYIHVLVYIKQETLDLIRTKRNKPKIVPDDSIGIDFGVKTPIVLSDETVPDLSVEHPKSLKRAQRKFARSEYDSKNRFKAKQQVRIEHEKWRNAKKDKENKFIGQLKGYAVIGMQDDYLAAWQKLWGKQLTETMLGSIKRRILNLQTTELLDRWLPTTQECPACLKLNKLGLEERTYVCACGFKEDRDVKSAKVMKCYAVYQKAHPGRELNGLSVEERTAVYAIYPYKDNIASISLSGEAEALSFKTT